MENSHIFRDCPDAVKIRNCSKGYKLNHWNRSVHKRRIVFENLDLTLPQGVTYALLGASGCGKTTLLKCIIGFTKVDSGSVEIFGRRLDLAGTRTGSVIGYMPQEISLFAMLSIEQTLQYYGQILGLSNAFIKSQIKFFVDFLKLPPKETMNGKLSGGQSRRLSFAVAAIHKPRLLIIDEPTVGLDPIIREKLWSYLNQIKTNYSTTIILTTHYLEEARSANVVGLMHNGTMVAEGTPNQLMNAWKVSNLEDLFFQVCTKNLENKTTTNNDVIVHSQSEIECDTSPPTDSNGLHNNYDSLHGVWNSKDLLTGEHYEKNGSVKFRRLAAIVKKNFIQFYIYPFASMFLLGLPSIQIAFVMLAMMSKIEDLSVGVFNEDDGPYGKTYLDCLDGDLIKQVTYDSYEDGYRDVMQGTCISLIYIERNFSKAFSQRFLHTNILETNFSFSGILNITIDKTDFMLSNTLLLEFMNTFADFTRRAIFESDSHSNASINFFQFNWLPKELIDAPPLTTAAASGLLAMMYVIQMATSFLGLLLEKKNGYLERSLVIGVTFSEIIFGSIIIQCLIGLIQTAGVLIVTFAIFRAPLLGPIGPVIFMLVLSGLVGMSAGLLYSSLTNDMLTCGSMGYSLALIIIAVSGMVMPLESSLYYFRYFCMCLPFYLPSEALEDIMYRSLSLFQMDVLIAILIMFAWIIVPIFLAIISLHKIGL